MPRVRNVVPFAMHGESFTRTETLTVSTSESLLVEANRCVCGNCLQMVNIKEAPSQCVNQNCETEWKQILVHKRALTPEHPTLPVYGMEIVNGRSADAHERRLTYHFGRIVRLSVSIDVFTDSGLQNEPAAEYPVAPVDNS